MKKTLLLTTALVGSMALSQAALAAETAKPEASKSPITVTLGGSGQFTAAVVDDGDITKVTGDSTSERGADFDADLIAYADAKTDAGLEYGAQFQILKNDNDPEEGNDQQFVYVGGNWGKVEAGNADGASDKMAIYAPNDFGTGGVTGKYFQYLTSGTSFDGIGGYDDIAVANKRYKAFDSDISSKISYYSPKFAGFQVGGSYAPNADGSGRNDKYDATTDADSVFGQATRTAFQDFAEAGINYEADFSDVNFKLGGTYTHATATSGTINDLDAYQVGTKVGYMGFTLGGGYVFQGDSGIASNVSNTQDSTGYNFGLQYETGPFIVGANALFTENQGYDAATSNKMDVYSVGATYVLAPGLSTFVEGSFVPKNEGSYNPASTTSATDTGKYDVSNSSVVLVGTKVEF